MSFPHSRKEGVRDRGMIQDSNLVSPGGLCSQTHDARKAWGRVRRCGSGEVWVWGGGRGVNIAEQ